MKNTTFIIAAIGIIVLAVILVFFGSPSSPFPPWDRSSEYHYLKHEDSVYLFVERHAVYIFVSQYGVWHSETPEIVKRSKEHNKAYGFFTTRYRTEEDFEKARKAFLEWKTEYNNEEKNQIDLAAPTERYAIPQNENPYEWKPQEDFASFSEYYFENERDNFKNTYLFDKNLYL